MPDIIMNGKGFGTVAQKLLANGMNPAALRPWVNQETGECFINVNGKAVPIANATLRKDEWKHYDTAVIAAAQDRLVGVADLQSRGLTYNLGNGLSKTVLEYEDMSDINDAVLTMDGLTRGENDRPEYDIKYLPLPIVHKDFQINARVLAASRNGGSPLDTTMASMASMKVADKLEDILFNGASAYSFGGGTIRGYTDHPNRNTVTLSAQWDASGTTGEAILDDVLAMKQASLNDKRYGPWVLYIPSGYETVLDDDYVSGYPKSIRQRIMEVDGIQAIRVADKLTAHNVLLVEMRPTTVRLVTGMPITTVEWSAEGNMVFKFKVMTIQVPQIRADQEGNCGIIHLSA